MKTKINSIGLEKDPKDTTFFTAPIRRKFGNSQKKNSLFVGNGSDKCFHMKFKEFGDIVFRQQVQFCMAC